MHNPKNSELALVMSGGGARAAYQVGFLKSLARRHPELAPPILTGVSSGAINAAYLANHEDSFADKVSRLYAAWDSLSVDQVFRVGSASLAGNVLRWGTRLMMGRASGAIQIRSLVDNTPLVELLDRLLQPEDGVLAGIERNLDRGSLRAVAITASSYTTGRSITWVQGRGVEPWERAHRKSIPAQLGRDHVLASASLPLFFPAVRVDNCWYGDGGIRLTAPLSPAIHLGARRILAISTRYGRTVAEAECPSVDGYPPPAQIVGVLFNAIFLDLFDNDALRLERINELIGKRADAEQGQLHRIELLLLRPSRDLGKLANDYEARLPSAFRFLTRGLGTKDTRSNDLLSLVMFQADYLRSLMLIGEADAEKRAAEIDAFLTGVPGASTDASPEPAAKG